MSEQRICTWTRVELGAYTDYWQTGCGKRVGISGPIEVGMWFNPDPSGNYCEHCGGKLRLDRWSQVEEKSDE